MVLLIFAAISAPSLVVNHQAQTVAKTLEATFGMPRELNERMASSSFIWTLRHICINRYTYAYVIYDSSDICAYHIVYIFACAIFFGKYQLPALGIARSNMLYSQVWFLENRTSGLAAAVPATWGIEVSGGDFNFLIRWKKKLSARFRCFFSSTRNERLGLKDVDLFSIPGFVQAFKPTCAAQCAQPSPGTSLLSSGTWWASSWRIWWTEVKRKVTIVVF